MLLFLMMQLAMASSMVLSNVTSPILILAVVQPMLAEVPTASRYARSMMLGMSFASNLGGWLSPIASVTNIIATSALHRHHVAISFIEWVAMAVPLAQIGLLAIFAVVLLLIRPDDDGKEAFVALPAITGAPEDLRLSLTKKLMLLSVRLHGSVRLMP